jgi:hypothetical protein
VVALDDDIGMSGVFGISVRRGAVGVLRIAFRSMVQV